MKLDTSKFITKINVQSRISLRSINLCIQKSNGFLWQHFSWVTLHSLTADETSITLSYHPIWPPRSYIWLFLWFGPKKSQPVICFPSPLIWQEFSGQMVVGLGLIVSLNRFWSRGFQLKVFNLPVCHLVNVWKKNNNNNKDKIKKKDKTENINNTKKRFLLFVTAGFIVALFIFLQLWLIWLEEKEPWNGPRAAEMRFRSFSG